MGHDHSHDWRPVPILPYRDAAVTAAFWTALGFRVVDAEWSVRGLPAEGLGSLATPEVKPWGLLEAWVTDPDGTVVRFGSGG